MKTLLDAVKATGASAAIRLAGSGATLTWSAGTLLLGTERQAVTVNYTPYPDF